MATADYNTDEPLLAEKRKQDLQETLNKVGLDSEFWLPKLQECLGVTCAQALQYLQEKDLQVLKSQVQHPWEKRALEKLFDLSHSNIHPVIQESPVQMINKRQKQVEEALQELKDLLLEGKQRPEEAVRRKEEELRQAMEIPEEYWPLPEKSLRQVLENMERHLSLMEQTLFHRQNLSYQDLVRWASGGLALQGIYQTSQQGDLVQKREELLNVPKEFSLFGPQQGTRMETKEFTSSQAESMFTHTMEKLGFSVTASARGGGWGLRLECGIDKSKYSESKETHQSHSEHSYYCSTKFSYMPLSCCHFSTDQLQFSKAALQELNCIENLLDHTASPLLKQRIEHFFQRFGSHANQGPLHLGGIYWWKAVSEGFQREQLEDVKQQASEALDIYIRGSYRGFGVKVAASMTLSELDSKKASQNKTLQKHQTNIKLSVAQTGGPPEADGLVQWKTGLVASNQTWCVIDRGLQLVPVWDIILSSHRSDFKDALKVAKCMKDNYTALTGLSAQIQYGEEILSAEEEARVFLEDIKSWEVSDPEEQLKKLINLMQMLCHKIIGYDTWINICLTNWDLQNFLVNTINFCKKSSICDTKFIKSQLRILLDPHVYKVPNFPQAHSIMQWIYESESKQKEVNISEFAELNKILKESLDGLLEVKVKSDSPETVEEIQRKVTYEVSMALTSFLNYLGETEQTDTQLLLLCIAVGAGYHLVNNTFQNLLHCGELSFLLDKVQSAQSKYKELKHISIHRAQAFLVLICLTASAGITALSPEEKTQRMALIRKYMGQSLSKEVAHVLKKSGAGHSWENLEEDLRLIIDGDYEDTRSPLHVDNNKEQLQSLPEGNKQTYKPHDQDNTNQKVTENAAVLDLLQRLGLEHYFPKRMRRTNFHLICKTSVHRTQPSSEQELPFYFLQKLLVLDYGLRYLGLKEEENTEHQLYPSASDQENEASDPYEDLSNDGNSPVTSKPRPRIHPMDIQMAIFHCADDFARQYILAKLSICQFALPLLVPNPCTSQIEFSLWCLKQVRRSWQHTSKSAKGKCSFHNQQMCCVPTSIVSFIRVGNGLSASKSQIMNYLLTKRKHDVFFHRHCKGSSKDCLLMEGVVEVCWFCPGEEDEDRFENCVAFTNLHGDAKENKQQLAFLQEVSSLIVVLMSASDDNEENRKIVRALWQSSTPLICLLDDKEKNTVNNFGRKIRIGIQNRNEADLTEEITIAMRRLLELSDTAVSMEDCSAIAREQGFLIDEDQTECKESKEMAEIIMALLRETNFSHMKENLLPLQGKLWHLWCKNDKELYHLREKGNRSIEQHKTEIEKEKQTIRHQQLQKALHPSDLMRSFVQILQKHPETHIKLYFLQWVSIFLEKHTGGHLEELHKKQRTLWSKIQTEKQKAQKSKSLDLWQNEIEAISTEISDCTLGIEQLLREVGQMYEAVEETSYKGDIIFLSLPQIAADLMLSGMPIELMDGDASYVPLKWVAAVFDKVSEKLPGKRVFVLSILGLQSSGKSTLLNALFGLQFSVSAGRCTRGAYMQLLKVEETFAQELGFDFMLVVDTEGLRAPEVINKSQNRDNELATFVIGLGNLTLIDIFGENPSEMQDILQIAVQAFLRMKQVKIFPSCLFVHQNVGEVTAKEQTMEGRRRLQQKLDDMAAMAAEQEQCSNVSCFGDVIKFDVNTDVHYFAHLWDGNPPMAPPNPRYSHNVQELKSRILLMAQQESRGKIMKISDVKFRVEDLWRALVSENFIFSFRNTREVMAMSKLETMYNQWSWRLRSRMLNLQNQLNNQIQNGKIQILKRSSLEDPITKEYETVKEDLEKYFKEDQESEILIQWKGNFENKLLILKDTLVSDAFKEANKHVDLKKSQDRLNEKKTSYENEILERSRELALTVKSKELSEEELQKKFNQLWIKWVCDVSSNLPPAIEPNIEVDSENILLEQFKTEKNLANILKTNSGKKFEINYDKHIKMSRKFWGVKHQLEAGDKEIINMTTKRIVSRFDETISNIQKQHRDYNATDFHEILRIIEEEVASAPTNQKYSFTSQYTIELSLCLFEIASNSFKEMHRAFETANDPVIYLNSKKHDFFMSFKISCQGATSIKSFVDFLWNKLIPAVSTTIWENMAPKIAGDLQATCPAFNGNRAQLEKHILISLAEEEDFDNYWQYIHYPKSFFSGYIGKQINRYCTEEVDKKIKTFLKINLDIIKTAILCAIHESTAQAKDKSSTASEWLDLFCDHLGNKLIFPRADLRGIEHQEIKDMEFLKEAMIEVLDAAMTKAEEMFSSTPITGMVSKVERILSEQLCGCWKQCPFCNAICTNTIPNHDGDHSAPFHRPKAVNGWHWYKTDEFAIDCCSTSVASNNLIVLSETWKIPFKTYRLAGGDYAAWSITPDLSSQPHWKWFVFHFKSKLEEKYKFKFKNRGEIPEAWAKIRKEDVLLDLKK
ncbi:PREDICTED: interferon-induced very large GTPase 1-like [Chinchilla lanigera]|uniref:interferon-induced very large GTPase 1-like n=1 Tax=Chinchilla lanigera TaxID=34839 RepID=UPI00038EDC82|nr:PREDICTED: interferon-induced very large GTPase 1-like [Chinchilla lanigera]